MSLVCSLSGEVPEHPVLSKISGHVFEKRLLEKYIAQNGMDPANGQPMTEDDVIPIQTKKVVKPRPPNACSTPGLIKLLQDEWDALMMETYQLKKSLDLTRQELAHSLYQHDAACRVIARLIKERDEARTILANVPHQMVQGAANNATVGPEAMNAVEESYQQQGIPGPVVTAISEKAKELQSYRKKRKKPAELASKNTVSIFRLAATFSGIHSASAPGITTVAIHPTDVNLVMTGGNDKNAVLYDRSKEQIVSTFKGHTKKITKVRIHPEGQVGITASGDSTVRLWSLNQAEAGAAHVFSCHSKEAPSVEVHPTGAQMVTASLDGKWAMHDLASQATLGVFGSPNKTPIHTARAHPDGMLLGLGCENSLIYIVDIFSGNTMAEFPGHTGPVVDMCFSENGYHMATVSTDNTVRLWDLRGNKTLNFRTMEFSSDFNLSAVQWDHSGSYLAVAGKDIRVMVAKQWDELARLEDHTSTVTDIAFGPLAQFLVSSSMDRTLRMWCPPSV